MKLEWAPWPLPRSQVLARFAVVAVMAALTIALYVGIGRFYVEGPEQLPNGTFSAGLDGWTRVGEVSVVAPGVARIVNTAPGRSAGLQHVLPGTADTIYLEMSGELRHENVVGGPVEWQRARLVLFSREANGDPRFSIPHEVVRLQGSGEWKHYAKVFRVPPTAVIVVSPQIVMATGVLEARNLSVRPAHIRPGFDAAQYTLMVAWVATVLWVLWPLLRAARRQWSLALVIVMLAAIGTATLMNQDTRIVLRTWVNSFVPKLKSADPPPLPAMTPGGAATAPNGPVQAARALFAEGPNMLWQQIDKTGHYSVYVVLAFMVMMLCRRRWPGQVPLVPILALFSLAALSEVWQFMSEDRGPSFKDVGTNSSGVATGLLLFFLMAWLWGRLSRRTTG